MTEGAAGTAGGRDFSLAAVLQGGRLQAEAVLLMAALRRLEPRRAYRVVLCQPLPGPLWPDLPQPDPEARAFLEAAGAEIVPFRPRIFGAAYPQGHKIEALGVLPPGRPFLFLDTDTLPLGPLGGLGLDFDRPAASLRREDTWPRPLPGGPSRAAIWGALYRRFGLDPEAAQDPARDPQDWRRFPYYNAGWFFGRCPAEFGALFERIARGIRDDPPAELAGQKLTPWLDQIALPLVVHRLGGGPWAVPEGKLDGAATLHYRLLALLYATAPDAVVAHLEALAAEPGTGALLCRHEAFRLYLREGWGARVRALFDRTALPQAERGIRQRIRAAGLWCR